MQVASEGYPDNWAEIALAVKEQAGWRCEHCGHPHDVVSGHVLTVHHLDGDPANCALENLVALCQPACASHADRRCHLHLQAKYQTEQTVMGLAVMAWMEERGLV